MSDVEKICQRNHDNVKQAEEMDKAYREMERELQRRSRRRAKDEAELKNLRMACWTANVCTGLCAAIAALYFARGIAFLGFIAIITALALIGLSVLFEDRVEELRRENV